MIVATIQVSGVNATTTSSQTIPAGIIGARVELHYIDPMWDGLSKTVVLKGCVTKDVVGAGDSVVIPAEVVAKPGVRVMVGVYGVDEENNIAIPTLWASIGVVKPAADPAGDESTDGTLPVWAQIEARVSELEQNPVDTETVTGIVAQYMEENPPEPGPEGPQGPQGEQGPAGADGANGQDGYTPIRGADYWTDADKTEIIEEVLEQMPESEGSGIDVSGATVGQTVKITAVDDKGVPTAWEPTDFPSGGGSEEYELMATVDMVQDAKYARVDLPWTAKKLLINASANGTALATANGAFCIATGSYGYANQKLGIVGSTQGMASTWVSFVMTIDLTFPKPMSVCTVSANTVTNYVTSYTGNMRPSTIFITSQDQSKTFNAHTWYVYGVRA